MPSLVLCKWSGNKEDWWTWIMQEDERSLKRTWTPQTNNINSLTQEELDQSFKKNLVVKKMEAFARGGCICFSFSKTHSSGYFYLLLHQIFWSLMSALWTPQAIDAVAFFLHASSSPFFLLSASCNWQIELRLQR